MNTGQPSSRKSKYKDDVIRDYILSYKLLHDGISPPIRHVSECYGDQEGIYPSSSMTRTVIKRICKTNKWNYTYRGIETQGEWYAGNDSTTKQ